MATAELTALQEQHDAARLERDTIVMRLEAREAEHAVKVLEGVGSVVQEAWGDLVNRNEWRHDTPDFNTGSSQYATRRDDRTGGKNRPIYESENDLDEIRGTGRYAARTSTGTNIQGMLTDYTIGGGYEVTVEADESTSEQLIERVERCLEEFQDRVDWKGSLDRELHDRSREDGEFFLALKPRGWQTEVEVLEPEWVTQPRDARDLDAWLDLAYPSCWAFGVLNPHGQPYRPQGFHIVRDTQGNDWDYFPAEDTEQARRIRTGVVEHYKRNVYRNQKRGVSDYHPVWEDVKRTDKVWVNTATGSAIQSAIAYIREHVSGTSNAGIQNLQRSNAWSSQQAATPLGTRTTYQQKIDPGTIIDCKEGTQYKPGPLGSSHAPNFINVIQAGLRKVGIRWGFPEYMISGDASNAAFASTLVAESPFTKARESDQRHYKTPYLRIFWKVIRIAFDGGYFRGLVRDWEELVAQIKIILKPPSIATRNRSEETNRRSLLMKDGILSPETYAAEEDLDYQDEVQKGAKAQQAAPAMPGVFEQIAYGVQSLSAKVRMLESTHLREDCGSGAGGFKSGNSCAGGGGGGGGSQKVKDWAEKKLDDPEKAKAFTEWFGDSKVVDESGEPLVVYHGTTAEGEIASFDPSKGGSSTGKGSGDSQLGFFFAANSQAASEYTYKSGDQSGHVLPVHLKIEKPLVVNAPRGGQIDRAFQAKTIQKAIDSGHDGVLLRGVDTLGHKGDYYIAFKSNQIKSATGNKGTFNPKSNKITEGELLEDCGTGDGGFKAGNECSGGGGGGGGKTASKGRSRKATSGDGSKPKSYKNGKQAEDELSASTKPWRDGLDHDDTAGIKAYAGSSTSFDVNKGLREGKFPNPTAKVTAERMSKALDKADFPETVTTHRSINPKTPEEREAILSKFRKAQGGEVVDKAFVSATANKKYADTWGKNSAAAPIKCEVVVPKGSKAAYLPKDLVGRQEWEVVIQKNSKYRVKEVTGDTIRLELMAA